MLKRIRELDAQIGENEKFQHEFEIKLLLHNIKRNLQDFADRKWRQKR
jgi:hypothetical protein